MVKFTNLASAQHSHSSDINLWKWIVFFFCGQTKRCVVLLLYHLLWVHEKLMNAPHSFDEILY